MVYEEYKILIDATIFVSLYNHNDSNHERALKELSKIPINSSLYTTEQIISEAITVISQRVGKEQANLFTHKITESFPRLEIIFIEENIFKTSLAYFRAVNDKNVSFVDCTTLLLYEKLHFDAIFTHDKHFKKFGACMLADMVD